MVDGLGPPLHCGDRGSNPLHATKLRDRAEVARKAHNLEVIGSSPVPATKKKNESFSKLFRNVGYKVSSLKKLHTETYLRIDGSNGRLWS